MIFKEDGKCLKCEGGHYIVKKRKEHSPYFGEVTVSSTLCDTCGHDYGEYMQEKIQEAYLNGEID
ncbi:hypothetical protein ACT414_18770 (plasmid) [Acinetobacter baumannii]